MQTVNTQSGFTLVELLVTVSVAGMILVMAVPAFNNMVTSNRLTTTTNNLIASFSYARSEAIRGAQTVTITAGAGGWGDGWTISDQAGNPIRVFEAAPNTVEVASDVTTLRFDSRGLMLGQAAAVTISICDEKGHVAGRQIEISPTGRPQLERKYSGGCG